MTVSHGLPVSRLVSVQVVLESQAAAVPAINTCLLLGTSDVIDAEERMREYANISDVAADFGTDSEEFLAAEPWFSQAPRPDNLMIGRWIKAASEAILYCGVLPPAEQLLPLWHAIIAGSFKITTQAAAVPTAHEISGLDFSTAFNLNGVASTIDAALTTATVPAHCTWDGQRFIFKSTGTGTGVAVDYLAPTTVVTGVDISAMLHGTALTGATGVVGLAPETALKAVVTLDDMFSARWYGLVCPSADDSEHEQLAAYCEAANPPHYYGATTPDPATMDGTSTADLAYVLSNFGYNKSCAQFSMTHLYAIMSYMARILTTQWGGMNTTITEMYKQEPGVAPETLTTQEANVVQRKGCNVYVAYANDTQIIQYGTSCSGEFTDTIVGADALAAFIQTALWNVLYTTATKIPQTDTGMGYLINAVTDVCAQFVTNGYIAPGIWNASGFGTLKTGDLVALGFYVWAPSMLLQSQADRSARKAPLIQVAVKLAGAIHTVDCLIIINS